MPEAGHRPCALTFDPLRATNASLNIHRLGATSDTYLQDYYGEMAGNNSGLSSDRLMVEWELAALAAGQARPPEATVPSAVTLPEDLEALTPDAPDRARALRLALRAELQTAFAMGRRVADFDRGQRQHLLTP